MLPDLYFFLLLLSSLLLLMVLAALPPRYLSRLTCCLSFSQQLMGTPGRQTLLEGPAPVSSAVACVSFQSFFL